MRSRRRQTLQPGRGWLGLFPIALVALLLTGCASTPSEPEIILQPSGPGEIEVQFELDPPVSELAFAQPATRMRLQQWQVLDDDLILQQDALHNTAHGERLDRARVRIHAEPGPRYREYPPVIAFADGGLLVHTATLIPAGVDQMQLYLEAGDWHTAIPAHEPNTQAVVDTFDPERITGIWVYLGPEPARETHYGHLVVDPGLPEALVTEAQTLLAAAHDYFSERMGERRRPLLAAIHQIERDPAVLEGDFSRGPSLRLGIGAPDELLQAGIRPPALSERALAHLIGHEMGHRWNTDLIRPEAGPAAAWMVEGSAELFALRFSEHLGLRDETDREAEISTNITECREVLERRPLADIQPPEPDYRAHYSCGLIFSLLTEQAFTEGDIFVFWQLMNALFHEASEYTQENYLGVLAEYGGEETVTAIARMITDSEADRAALLDEALQEAGIRP